MVTQRSTQRRQLNNDNYQFYSATTHVNRYVCCPTWFTVKKDSEKNFTNKLVRIDCQINNCLVVVATCRAFDIFQVKNMTFNRNATIRDIYNSCLSITKFECILFFIKSLISDHEYIERFPGKN